MDHLRRCIPYPPRIAPEPEFAFRTSNPILFLNSNTLLSYKQNHTLPSLYISLNPLFLNPSSGRGISSALRVMENQFRKYARFVICDSGEVT